MDARQIRGDRKEGEEHEELTEAAFQEVFGSITFMVVGATGERVSTPLDADASPTRFGIEWRSGG